MNLDRQAPRFGAPGDPLDRVTRSDEDELVLRLILGLQSDLSQAAEALERGADASAGARVEAKGAAERERIHSVFAELVGLVLSYRRSSRRAARQARLLIGVLSLATAGLALVASIALFGWNGLDVFGAAAIVATVLMGVQRLFR